MGVWGDEPWENDGAADWLAELFETSELRRRILEGLNKVYAHPEGESEPALEVVRVAAQVLVSLADVWPQRHQLEDLSLAEDKLRALLDGGIFEDHGYEGEALDSIRGELAAIRTLLGAPPAGTFRPSPLEGACCAFSVTHTEHIELTEPVVRRGARLQELLGADPKALGWLIKCGGWLVLEQGSTERSPGEILHDVDYMPLRDAPGFRAETGARALQAHLPEDTHEHVLLRRIPDLRGTSKPLDKITRQVVQTSERLAKLVELGAPPVILQNQRGDLQRAVDSFVKHISSG